MIQNQGQLPPVALPLTRRRPEAIALVLVLWSSALWVLATPGPLDRFGTLKGTDFSQFYVSARLVASGAADRLYDWSWYVHELTTAVPGPEGLLYLPVYPPVLAAVLAPLGAMGYLAALATWTLISTSLYVFSGLLLASRLTALRRDPVSTGVLLLGFPAFQQLLLYGQISAVALLLVVLAWYAYVGGYRMLAGVALGALFFKPQMLTLAVSALVLAPSWALAAGVATGIATELLLTTVRLGLGALTGYGDTVRRILAHPAAFEPKAEQIQSLRGFFLAFAGPEIVTTILFIVSGVAVLILAFRTTRGASQHQIFAAIVLSGLLVNPHLYAYDLVVLLVPLAIAASLYADMPDSWRGVGRAAYAVYWLPLVTPVLGLLHIQLMAPVMLWLLWSFVRAARTPSIAHH